jgi:hypothetical protein
VAQSFNVLHSSYYTFHQHFVYCCCFFVDPDGLTRRRPSRLQRPSLTLQPHLPAFSQLHSLSLLSGAERLLFTLQDPAAAWAAMPQLQQLRLQGVGLGYGTNSKPLPDRQVRT